MTVKMLGLLGLAATLFVAPAFAHHSFSMFDAQKTQTVNGVVKELEWTNPHSWLYIMVEDNGQPVEYSFEMQGTGQSVKNGWKPDSVKAGDKVSVEMHPLRTGAHGGQLLTVILPTGEKLGVTGRAPSAVTGQ